MSEKAKFLVYRNSGNGKIRYERYEVPLFKGMSILEALFYIQDHYDSTLAFRYACRGAICGSCGITIDKVPDLACRVQVSGVKTAKKPVNLPEFKFGDHSNWDSNKEILIEPLPNMAVLKDLVVDMDPFFERMRAIHPESWRTISPVEISEEFRQSQENHRDIQDAIKCIMCGCCTASCPINLEEEHEYMGPAAALRATRYIFDTRIMDTEARMDILDRPHGIWACKTYWRCTQVCPKGIHVTMNITKSKTKLLLRKS